MLTVISTTIRFPHKTMSNNKNRKKEKRNQLKIIIIMGTVIIRRKIRKISKLLVKPSHLIKKI